jgi:hypothetical protein
MGMGIGPTKGVDVGTGIDAGSPSEISDDEADSSETAVAVTATTCCSPTGVDPAGGAGFELIKI